MDTKKDINTRADSECLIIEFYVLIKKGSIIGFIFTEVVTIN